MMMAVGCIQSQRCHTNQCPVGVATQDPKRSRALDVADKTERVYRYQHAVVAEAQRLIASMGLHSPAEVGPHHLVRRVDHVTLAQLRRAVRVAASRASCSTSRRSPGRPTGRARTRTRSRPHEIAMRSA